MGRFYEKLMLQVLEDALNRFYRRDVEPYLRSYLETVISLSFFRLPFFNEMFLECIEEMDDQVEEWQGVGWDINIDVPLKKDTSVSHLFNW